MIMSNDVSAPPNKNTPLTFLVRGVFFACNQPVSLSLEDFPPTP